MARTLETPIQKRFSDVDPFQHVNNVSQQMYFDVGKMEFYEKVLGAEVLLADLQILTVMIKEISPRPVLFIAG